MHGSAFERKGTTQLLTRRLPWDQLCDPDSESTVLCQAFRNTTAKTPNTSCLHSHIYLFQTFVSPLHFRSQPNRVCTHSQIRSSRLASTLCQVPGNFSTAFTASRTPTREGTSPAQPCCPVTHVVPLPVKENLRSHLFLSLPLLDVHLCKLAR